MTGLRYIAIDLKSFYASVECRERNWNPLSANLVVADASRTEKTICLAVSPSLKSYGIPGRARLFEVVQAVKRINAERLKRAPGHRFTGKSIFADELEAHPEYALDYCVAPPQMALYMEYSTKIYGIYLRYIAPEDIHVYSVDEVFMDVSAYLRTYGMTPEQLARKMIQDVLEETGITATAGVGSNLYLCKVAMDVEAKHIEPDEDGVRIACLDEQTYRRSLWTHRPITDFWRVGRGYAGKLAEHGMYTMGDVARCSAGKESEYYNEDLLYRLFGVNAELLIDHAWGWEPCTIADIKSYRPSANSVSTGQVLQCPYSFDKARLIVHEMTDLLVLDLVDKGLVTDQMVLTVGYDIDNLKKVSGKKRYTGEVATDRYGRKIPKHAHGTQNLPERTSSSRMIIQNVLELYDRIVDPELLVRRITVTACRVVPEEEAEDAGKYEQLTLFQDPDKVRIESEERQKTREKEKKIQHAILDIQKRYGKNALLKGMNLEEGATTIQRNGQIGGHKA